MYHIFCIHSSVEVYLGCLHLMAIINMAAMHIVGHVTFLHVGSSSGYIPRSGIAGSSGHSTMSNFLRNRQTDLCIESVRLCLFIGGIECIGVKRY